MSAARGGGGLSNGKKSQIGASIRHEAEEEKASSLRGRRGTKSNIANSAGKLTNEHKRGEGFHRNDDGGKC